MAASSPEPTHEVDSTTLRALFRAARIEDRLASGELTIVVKRGTERRAPARIGEPRGTVSHAVVYLDGQGRAQAIAHEYLRPDGSIGAGGQRDPKWLRYEGAVWQLQRPRAATE
jgi:hypothetical protein